MPYIKPEAKPEVDVLIDQLPVDVEGTITYAITRLLHRYLKAKGLKYVNLAMAIALLETAKLELYRAVVGPYENQKIKENGFATDLDAALNAQDQLT